MERCHVRIVGQVLAHLVLSGVSSGRLEGQLPLDLSVTAFGGAVEPRGGMFGDRLVGTERRLNYGDFDPVWGAGGSLEVGSDALPLALRLTGSRSGWSEETAHLSCVPSRVVSFCTAELTLVPTEFRVTTVGLDLTGAVPLGHVEVHPALGVGWARQTHRWDGGVRADDWFEEGTARVDATGVRGGIGISVPLTRWVRVRGDWSELVTGGGGGFYPTRPERFSSFTVGTELVIGGWREHCAGDVTPRSPRSFF